MIFAREKVIKFARIRQGKLQREIAEDLSITTNSYALIENGKRSASPHLALRICSKYDASFDDLFEIKEE